MNIASDISGAAAPPPPGPLPRSFRTQRVLARSNRARPPEAEAQTTPREPVSVAVRDFDRDGILDLAVANRLAGHDARWNTDLVEEIKTKLRFACVADSRESPRRRFQILHHTKNRQVDPPPSLLWVYDYIRKWRISALATTACKRLQRDQH